jgi:CheY-specific phosphatase CheX
MNKENFPIFQLEKGFKMALKSKALCEEGISSAVQSISEMMDMSGKEFDELAEESIAEYTEHLLFCVNNLEETNSILKQYAPHFN